MCLPFLVGVANVFTCDPPSLPLFSPGQQKLPGSQLFTKPSIQSDFGNFETLTLLLGYLLSTGKFYGLIYSANDANHTTILNCLR